MRLVRWGDAGAEKPGMIDADGALRDLSAQIDDVNGHTLAPDVLARLQSLDPGALPLVEAVRVLAPVSAMSANLYVLD